MSDRPDTFRGDDAHLIRCIDALLSLGDADALVPNKLSAGSHAYELLNSARHRLIVRLAAAHKTEDVETIRYALDHAVAGGRVVAAVDVAPLKRVLAALSAGVDAEGGSR